MNERFFAQITTRRIRRGSYSSVDDLEAAICDYLARHNEKPKPFRWTRTAEDIPARESRALDALDQIRGNSQQVSDSEHQLRRRRAAARLGRLDVPGFARDRMTWIKPSFLWMMYRCGWGEKDPGQTAILRIRMRIDAFWTILSAAALSSFGPEVVESHDEWRARLRTHPNRVQWDPDRDIFLAPMTRRAIQVGISPDFAPTYLDSIAGIDDITQWAQSIRDEIAEVGRSARLPAERAMPIDES